MLALGNVGDDLTIRANENTTDGNGNAGGGDAGLVLAFGDVGDDTLLGGSGGDELFGDAG